MIKLMIADDEQYERDYLHKAISERYAGILDIVYMAKDGAEVLEKAEEYRPDIILMDIRMPRVDGIEAAAQLVRKYPELQLVIVSAYGEFSYAKQALKIGVKDFLVKPYLDNELAETLDKVIAELGTKFENNLDKQESEGEFNFHEDIDKDIVWDAAFGRKKTPMLQKELAMWGVQDCSFKSIVFLNNGICRMGPIGYEILKGIFCIKHTYVIMSYLFRHLVVYVFAEEDSAYAALNGCIRKARNYIKELDKETVFCGTSGIYQDYNELSKAYQEAVRYVSEYSSPEIKENLEMDIEKSWQLCDLEDKAYFYLANGNMELSLFWLRKIWELLGGEDGTEEAFRKCTLRRSLMTIIRKINKLPESRVHTADATHLFQLFSHVENEESKLYQFLEECAQLIIKSKKSVRINNNTFVVRDAKSYIENHYNEPISLQSVSRALGISTGYLSKCFKNVEGSSFTEYLTDYRLTKAKELIRLGNSTITDIAYKVGFSDSNYFGKCFKKKEKMSPKEYYTIQAMDSNVEMEWD
jgi:YesN/AraC family two-component response regulator